jgi:hypothetical protein
MPTAEAGSWRVHLKPQAKCPHCRSGTRPSVLSQALSLSGTVAALPRGCQWQPAAAGPRRPARACRVRGGDSWLTGSL